MSIFGAPRPEKVAKLLLYFFPGKGYNNPDILVKFWRAYNYGCGKQYCTFR